MVDLLVGPEAQVIRIHKAFLCKISYFDKMFNVSFREAHEQKTSFPEDNPKAFGILVDWIHTDTIPGLCFVGDPKKKVMSWNPFTLYSLAEKFCLSNLMDTIMDAYRKRHGKGNKILTYANIQACYDFSADGSTLRRFAFDSFCYLMGRRLSEKEREIWSNQGASDLLKANDDLRNAFIPRLRCEGIHIRIDPRRGFHCEYHCHGKEEACTVSRPADK